MEVDGVGMVFVMSGSWKMEARWRSSWAGSQANGWMSLWPGIFAEHCCRHVNTLFLSLSIPLRWATFVVIELPLLVFVPYNRSLRN